jgi:hypothetical protein
MDTSQISPSDARGSTKLRKTSLIQSISPSAPVKPSAQNNNQSPSHSALWSNPAPFHERAVSIADSKPSLSDDSSIAPPEMAYISPGQRLRRGTVSTIIQHFVPDSVARTFTKESVFQRARRGTVWAMYNKAHDREAKRNRKRWVQVLFEASVYVLLVSFVYFVLIGRPLWRGAVWWMYWVMKHKFVFRGGVWISLGIAFV